MSLMILTYRAGAFVTLSALFAGACALDTAPASPATRAALEVESPETPAATSSNLGTAGAAAPQQPPPTVPASPETAAEPEDPPEMAEAREPEPEPAAPEAKREAPPEARGDVVEAPKGACRPGKYSGVISGTVNLTGILAVSTMSGTVDVELVADKQYADVLVVQKGRVTGLDDNRGKFSADLTGHVKCTSGELVGSTVERGTFEDATLPMQLGFAGEATGQYTQDPPALVGTWSFSDEIALLVGHGTWSTTLSESL
jgi:hypothetical protein